MRSTIAISVIFSRVSITDDVYAGSGIWPREEEKMSVIVTDMVFPKECGECEWFCFEGITCTTPQYYLDARCRRIPSGQDWYGEDRRGGWIGKSIAHLPGYGGRYPHEHCIEFGTRPENCPLIELPKHGDLIDRDEAIKTIGKLAELMEEKCGYEVEKT